MLTRRQLFKGLLGTLPALPLVLIDRKEMPPDSPEQSDVIRIDRTVGALSGCVFRRPVTVFAEGSVIITHNVFTMAESPMLTAHGRGGTIEVS